MLPISRKKTLLKYKNRLFTYVKTSQISVRFFYEINDIIRLYSDI